MDRDVEHIIRDVLYDVDCCLGSDSYCEMVERLRELKEYLEELEDA